MGKVETAQILSLIGGILVSMIGTIYLILGVLSIWWWWVTWLGTWATIISGFLWLIFGPLTLFVARPYLEEGEDLKTGAILCFIFGGITTIALGAGILTIVAGVLAIIAWSEQEKEVKVRPPPKPEVKVAYCPSCGAQLSPGAAFCPSCGKEIKKE